MRRREQIAELEHALENERAENERIREELMRCTIDPPPVMPPDEWERRRAAWLPDDDPLPRGRKALRELVLTQRVEIAELVERVDDLTNELEGWRSTADAELADVRTAHLEGELASARAELDSWRTGERSSELGRVVEARGSALAAAQSLLKRKSDENASLELDRDGWRSRAEALESQLRNEEHVGSQAQLELTRTNRDAQTRLDAVRDVLKRNERTRADDQDGMRRMYREIDDALDGVFTGVQS